MTADATPFNYRYFVDLLADEKGRILDYGCGVGDIVALGRERGLDIWGANKFDGFWQYMLDNLRPGARDRVGAISGQHADYADGSFDVVISNQVLEHVPDPEALIADVHRLLRPGGLFIAAFPVVETWYEGHVGLYFAHRMAKGGSARRSYFELSHRFGFGLNRNRGDAATWAAYYEKFLDESCFYYPRSRMKTALESRFGTGISDGSADYMRARLGQRGKTLPRAVDPLLRFVYHVRAGEFFCVRKAALRLQRRGNLRRGTGGRFSSGGRARNNTVGDDRAKAPAGDTRGRGRRLRAAVRRSRSPDRNSRAAPYRRRDIPRRGDAGARARRRGWSVRARRQRALGNWRRCGNRG
jgi:SAM-dependent methyltransferase